MRKYVTKKLLKHISSLTNSLFKQSVVEVMNIKDATDEQIQDFMGTVRRAGHGFIFPDETDLDITDVLDKKEKIDDLYLSKMISLTTKDLNDILFLHEFGKPKRAIRTLEAIHLELARRELLNDSSQSDTIYHNGDVDVKRKSKPARKKAGSKKSKTNKDR